MNKRGVFLALTIVSCFAFLPACSTREVSALAEVVQFAEDARTMVRSHREVVASVKDTLVLANDILTVVKQLANSSSAAAEENRLAMMTVHEIAATVSALRALVVEMSSGVAELRAALKTR